MFHAKAKFCETKKSIHQRIGGNHNEIQKFAEDAKIRASNIPKSASALGSEITRILSGLRLLGFQVEKARTEQNTKRIIYIRKLQNPLSMPSKNLSNQS